MPVSIRRTRTTAVVLLLLLALNPAAGGATDEPTTSNKDAEHRWHTPRRSALEIPRHVLGPHAGDWNPLAKPTAFSKSALKRAHITSDTFVMFFYQWASDVHFGNQNFGSFAYRSIGDWEFLRESPIGDSFLEWNFTGAVGFSFDPEDESIAGGTQIGDASIINTNIYPDSGAIDELFWKQVIADGRWVVMAGRVDQSFHFDVNRVANDAFRKLQGFAFVNNLSIPWPLYGGIGAIVSWKTTDRLTLRLGGGESGSDEPWRFWETTDDGNWYQLLEAEYSLQVPGLGKGTYRLTPWHNHLDGEDGWGVGGNFDQELGPSWLVGFFRFGVGDGDVTPVDRYVSLGVGVETPFDRSGDLFTLGFAWSRPSDPTTRAETFFELQYRLQLTKTLELSPDLQIIINPASNFDTDVIVVPGVRFTMIF